MNEDEVVAAIEAELQRRGVDLGSLGETAAPRQFTGFYDALSDEDKSQIDSIRANGGTMEDFVPRGNSPLAQEVAKDDAVGDRLKQLENWDDWSFTIPVPRTSPFSQVSGIGEGENNDITFNPKLGLTALGDSVADITGRTVGGTVGGVVSGSPAKYIAGPIPGAIASIPGAVVGQVEGGRLARKKYRDFITEHWGAIPGEGIESQYDITDDIKGGPVPENQYNIDEQGNVTPSQENKFFKEPDRATDYALTATGEGLLGWLKIRGLQNAASNPGVQAATRLENQSRVPDQRINTTNQLGNPTNLSDVRTRADSVLAEPEKVQRSYLGANERATTSASGIAEDVKGNWEAIDNSQATTNARRLDGYDDSFNPENPAAGNLGHSIQQNAEVLRARAYQDKQAVLGQYNNVQVSGTDIVRAANTPGANAQGQAVPSLMQQARVMAGSAEPSTQAIGTRIMEFLDGFQPQPLIGQNGQPVIGPNGQAVMTNVRRYTPQQLAAEIENFNRGLRREGVFSHASSEASRLDSKAAAIEEDALRRTRNLLTDVLGGSLNPADLNAVENLNERMGAMYALERQASAKTTLLEQDLAQKGTSRATQPNTQQEPIKEIAEKRGFLNRLASLVPRWRYSPNQATANQARTVNAFREIPRSIADVDTIVNEGQSGRLQQSFDTFKNDTNFQPGFHATTGMVSSGLPQVGSQLGQMIHGEEDPYPNGLPRNPGMINQDLIMAAAQKVIMAYGPNVQPIVTKALLPYMQGVKNSQMSKMNAAYAALVQAFPGVFEGGFGVNGRVYDPSEREAVLMNLKNLAAQGKIPKALVAKQESAFNDANDLSLIDPKDYMGRPDKVEIGTSPKRVEDPSTGSMRTMPKQDQY